MKIKEIDTQIQLVGAKLQEGGNYLGMSDREELLEERKYLRAEKQQLRTKEEQLRAEKQQLRTKKEQLRAEKHQRRAEKRPLLHGEAWEGKLFPWPRI